MIIRSVSAVIRFSSFAANGAGRTLVRDLAMAMPWVCCDSAKDARSLRRSIIVTAPISTSTMMTILKVIKNVRPNLICGISARPQAKRV